MSASTTGYRRHPLPLDHVAIDDAFWTPRQEVIRTRTIPQQEQMLREGGQLEALTLTWKSGDENEPHIFWESDVAKWIEAASYTLSTHPDPALDRAVDTVIDLLAGAQQPDGYLNVYYTVVRPGERFTDLRDAHELYCLGHLVEAAVAHHTATGKTSLLDIVRRYADLVDRLFAPDGPYAGGYCGHEEIELALVKLFHATGERRYLELSRRFVSDRGTQPFYYEREAKQRTRAGWFDDHFPERDRQVERFRQYTQSHLPVVDQSEVVGHSVRAMYLYCAMTDLAAEYGDEALTAATQRLWRDLVDKKLYVTGGVGSDPSIEGFATPYDLPDRTGYAETCASIGLVFWAARMSRLTGQGEYVDVLEQALYNGVLSGASADGTHYFYGNPLASDGDVKRSEWFGCACCPPNLARVIAELGAYVYSLDAEARELLVNLYVANRASFTIGDRAVTISQQTDYPTGGSLTITIDPEQDGAASGEAAQDATEFTLGVRIPAWSSHTARVNGSEVSGDLTNGYLRLTRAWAAGDRVEITLDVSPHRVWANPLVRSTSGKVALQRGPFVYCLEGVDHDHPVANLILARDAELTEQVDAETSLVHLSAPGRVETPASDALYTAEPPTLGDATLTAVPYFSWGNRGTSDMTVWIRESV